MNWNPKRIQKDSKRLTMSKKIQVSFSDRQIDMINELRGEFGDSESEVVRTIVLIWLSENRLLHASLAKRQKPTSNFTDEGLYKS